MLKIGAKVRITPPHSAFKQYPGFCKKFTNMVGKLIRPTIPSLDRKAYPEDFVVLGLGKKHDEFLTVDVRWLTAVS